jgi:hypothetical protein
MSMPTTMTARVANPRVNDPDKIARRRVTPSAAEWKSRNARPPLILGLRKSPASASGYVHLHLLDTPFTDDVQTNILYEHTGYMRARIALLTFFGHSANVRVSTVIPAAHTSQVRTLGYIIISFDPLSPRSIRRLLRIKRPPLLPALPLRDLPPTSPIPPLVRILAHPLVFLSLL